MSETRCPDCGTPFKQRFVAPCYDCGDDPRELEHLEEGRHAYDEVELLGRHAILCDLCQADFSSYDPEYFGRKRPRLHRDMRFIRRLADPQGYATRSLPSATGGSCSCDS
jgi:hypothetical protein